MNIRKAKASDKNIVFEFCKDTFSWGDYIDKVWNHWITEGHLYVLEKDIPLGICHAFFSENQVWIEGIRIHPLFRRQGLASNLISHVELIAQKQNISVSLMLIDTKNSSSLFMAKNLNYEIIQTWRFYSLSAEPKTSTCKFGKIQKNTLPSHYVKSWRWLPLDNDVLDYLFKEQKIICSKTDSSFAILTESEHFEKTLIVTLQQSSQKNTAELIHSIQNYGFLHSFDRIQILTQNTLPKLQNLEFRISFHLMRKLLSNF